MDESLEEVAEVANAKVPPVADQRRFKRLNRLSWVEENSQKT